MQLTLNVGAMLLAFVALIALLNGMLSGIGGWFNYSELSLQLILGYLFAPVAFLIGRLCSMALHRRHDSARLGIKAVIAGTLSNLISASITGVFLTL